MRDIVINKILEPALCRLYETDYNNICWGVSERNICARLAHHMENIMREYDYLHNSSLFNSYYADVEYNRMGNGDLKHYENSEHRPRYFVSDLLIHARGRDCNFLAVEMKRKGNHRNVTSDKERLSRIVSFPSDILENECVYNTLIGAFITYSPQKVNIVLFENHRGKGRSTQEMTFIFKDRVLVKIGSVLTSDIKDNNYLD